MSIWTSLEPASTTVDAGGRTSVRLRLRNTGDVVEEYRFEPVGDIAPFITVEPPTLRLYPGTTGTVQLEFAPPRTPDATAGPNPYAIRITPTEHPEATAVPEGNLTITPFSEVRAELVPHTVKGRFRGRPRLAVDNLGNTKLTASINGSDNGDQLNYEIHPANVQIEPGRAAFVDATLRPRRITWFGHHETRPYTLAVQRSGIEPLTLDGRYIQQRILPRWLLTLGGMLVALAVVAVTFWFMHAPKVTSRAQDKLADTSATLSPTASPPPVLPNPSQPPAQSPPAAPPAGGSGGNGGGDGGGGGGGGGGDQTPASRSTDIALENASTNLCADIPGYGAGQLNGPVNEFRCNPTNDDNQLFDFDVRYAQGGPQGKDLFQIRNRKDHFCLDLPDYGAEPAGTVISEYNCTGTTADNQLWYLDKQPSGNFWLRNYASNDLCLDVTDPAKAGSDSRLDIGPCGDGQDSEWFFVKSKS